MRPSEALELNRQAVRDIALSHRVSSVRVFGSVVRGDDVKGSDLDRPERFRVQVLKEAVPVFDCLH